MVSSSVIAQANDSTIQSAPQAFAKQQGNGSLEVKARCLDDLPKLPTTEREQQIIDKIVEVVTTKYDSVEHAFSKLDLDQNGNLDRSEVSGLLRLARLGRIIRVIATGRLIDRYDVSEDDSIQWNEFNFAITKAIEKRARLANSDNTALLTPQTPSVLPVVSK